MKIRISLGVGSSPKLWAVGGGSQVGEFDVSSEPGRFDAEANGINGMSGIIWTGLATTTDRKLYASVEEWVADIAAMYPDTEIIRADDKPQNWL